MRLPNAWELVTLREICQKIQDGNYGADYPRAEEFLEKGVPFLTSKCIGSGNRIIETNLNFISTEKHSQLRKAQTRTRDLIWTNRGANVGSIALLPDNLDNSNIGPQLTIIRIDPGKALPEYIMNVMRSSLVLRQLHSFDTGSAMNFFGIETTGKFEIPLPPLPEQKKIARILSTWDKAIELLEKKIAAKEKLKKGLMQQLLTGKKRFKEFGKPAKDGELPEGWKEVKIGDVIEKQNVKQIQLKTNDYKTDGNIAIVDQGQELIAGYTDGVSFFSQVPVIIFGDHTRVVKWIDFPFVPGADGTHVLTVRQEHDPFFIFSAICQVRLPDLGYSRHSKYLFPASIIVPETKDEEVKIGTVLSKLTHSIHKVTLHTDALKLQKKGLMQQLLTGKKRVKV